jgi:cell division protein FtsW
MATRDDQPATTGDEDSTGRQRAASEIPASRRESSATRDSDSAPPSPTHAPEPRGLDLLLLGAVLGLLGLGIVLVYSASAVYAQAHYGSPFFFLRRHLAYAAVGLVALYLGWRVDYRIYRRLIYPMLFGVTALLALLFVPGLGTKIDGAIRWFRIAGISFQPSEAAKFVLVVYLAYSLAKKRDQVKSFTIGFLPHLCVAGLITLLVLKQPDLGSAAVLITVTLILLFVAGTKLSYIVICLLGALPLGYQQIVGTTWRLQRLFAFLDPWAHRKKWGYQISESLISVGSGGVTGLGLGAGKQKLFYLPASHTDFIFSQVGEELGLVGICVVVAAFVLITVRGIRAALGASDLFGTYLGFGLTAVFSLQGLFHMCVVLGLVPTKGITLPLISYGGTALNTAMFCMGVLLNIGARRGLLVQEGAPPGRISLGNRKNAPKIVVVEAQRERTAAGA